MASLVRIHLLSASTNDSAADRTLYLFFVYRLETAANHAVTLL